MSPNKFPPPDTSQSALLAEEPAHRTTEFDAFRVTLNDALLPLSDTLRIQDVAARVLGQHLGVDRAFYSEVVVENGVESCHMESVYHVPEHPLPPKRYPVASFGSLNEAALRKGHNVVVSDSEADERTPTTVSAAYRAFGMRAWVGIPLHKNGRLVAVLSVHQSQPRAWTTEEIRAMEEAAECIWAAVHRARSEAALRESEERFRAFVTASSDAIYSMNADWTQMRFLHGKDFISDTANANNSWLEQYIRSDDQPQVLEAINQAIATKSPFDLEHRVLRTDGTVGWTHSRAVPLLSETGEVSGWFGTARDVTARKRTEEDSRRSEEHQVFLLGLSDILQKLTDPAEIQRTAMQMLGEHLALSRAFYFRVEREAEDWAHVIEYEYCRDLRQGSMIGRHALKHFGSWLFEGLAQGRTLEVSDVNSLAELTPEERASYRTRGVVAFINAPLFRNGTYSAGITAHDTAPRAWQPAEIEVVRDVAERIWATIQRTCAEVALRESQQRLNLTVEAAQLGTCDWDYQAGVMRGNDQRFYLFGLQPTQGTITTQQFLNEIHPDDREATWATIMAQLTTRGRYGVEYRIQRPDDSVCWITETGRVIEWRGDEPSRIVSILADVTPRKEAEAVLRRSHAELEAHVQERTVDLQTEVARRQKLEGERLRLLKGIVAAQEEERKRLSRELHDQMGQTLTALMLGLKTLPPLEESDITRPTASDQIEHLQKLTEELTNQAHHLAWELRPAVLDNIGLEAALRQYVSEWSQRHGIPSDFLSHGLNGSTRLATDMESTLYRVVQEALNNVVRHAEATQVSVVLERRGQEVVTIIEDDGRGFDPEANLQRLGIVGMRERLEVISGSLIIESALGEGTTIYARVPLQHSPEQ